MRGTCELFYRYMYMGAFRRQIIILDFKGGVVQQPKYKEVDTDYVPSSNRGRGGGGRGRNKRAHHSHSLEDEASLYYVIRNNRSSLTVS